MIHPHEWQALFYCFSFFFFSASGVFRENATTSYPDVDMLPGQRAEKATFLLCIEKRGFIGRFGKYTVNRDILYVGRGSRKKRNGDDNKCGTFHNGMALLCLHHMKSCS